MSDPQEKDSPLRIDPGASAILAVAVLLPPNFHTALERTGKAVVKLELRVDGEACAPEKLDRDKPYRATDGTARTLWLVQSWWEDAKDVGRRKRRHVLILDRTQPRHDRREARGLA